MSNEKLRRETSGFDITFVDDKENNTIVLEKPLPIDAIDIRHPEALIGTICAYKKVDHESQERTSYTFYIGTVTSATRSYDIDIKSGDYVYTNGLSLHCTFNAAFLTNSLEITLAINKARNKVSIKSNWIDLSVTERCDTPYITLTATTDPATGDRTYTGSAWITSDAQDAMLTRGYIRMMTSEPFVQSNNAITGYWRESDPVDRYKYHLILGSYFKYDQREVRDADVILGSKVDETTTLIGQKCYSVSVTFTVPAANL